MKAWRLWAHAGGGMSSSVSNSSLSRLAGLRGGSSVPGAFAGYGSPGSLGPGFSVVDTHVYGQSVYGEPFEGYLGDVERSSDAGNESGGAAASPADGHSRALFVRNISSSVEDEELWLLFGKFGDVRRLFTQRKHNGFVIVSYFDLRHARAALMALHGQELRRRRLDIHYAIPRDHPSERDQNGTLVVFNLDAAVTSEELAAIFAEHGDVKEVRETPNKRQHKFVEFFDVRHAEAAMRALNRTEVRGKKIKIEVSRSSSSSSSSSHSSSSRRNSMPTGPVAASPSSPPGSTHHGSLPASTPADQNSFFSSGARSWDRDYMSSGSATAAAAASSSAVPRSLGSASRPWSGDDEPPHRPQHPQTFLMPEPNPDEIFDAISDGRRSSLKDSEASSRGSDLKDSNTSGGRAVDLKDSSASTTSSSRDGDSGDQAPRSLQSSSKLGSSEGSAGRRRGMSSSGGTSSKNDEAFTLDYERIRSGLDLRTTIMMRNIPNKYTQKMLLETVDERFHGKYDFFYLPIDFKNRCNVGYAFINFIAPVDIADFFEQFNQKKWTLFNSEKVCAVTYARIQGKQLLVSHFKDSSLMSEDKKCRPLIFFSDGPQRGEPEPFPVSTQSASRTHHHHRRHHHHQNSRGSRDSDRRRQRNRSPSRKSRNDDE